MRCLNNLASKTFLKLITLLPDSGFLEIDNQDYGVPPLTIEKLGIINTPIGVASVFSFAHYHRKGKDTMRDPEVIFWLMDDGETVFPVSYQNDYEEIYQEAIQISDNNELSIHSKLLNVLVAFTQRWFKAIREQQSGLLKKVAI